jgi:hypothetical protein
MRRPPGTAAGGDGPPTGGGGAGGVLPPNICFEAARNCGINLKYASELENQKYTKQLMQAPAGASPADL